MTGTHSRHGDVYRPRFRCLLVGIGSDREDGAAHALAQAIELARSDEAVLSLYVFAPRMHEPLPMSSASASAWLEEEAKRLEDLTSDAMRIAMAAASQSGIDVVSEHARSPFELRSGRLSRLARVNDLTILDAADLSDTLQRTVIEDVLFDSGRPLLLTPQHSSTTSRRRIAIAWDGSAQSARAVKDALPLLAVAEVVVAVTIKGEKDLSRPAPGADLAAYLARHGVDCRLVTLAATASHAAERLRLFILEEEMEMIVMGAFVHSRFRQAILGGFTRSMLDEPPVALFMAH